MLTIYGRTNSVNVQKVLWCLAELELPYTRIDAGLEHGKNDEPWYLTLNPNGQVPLLQDGAFTLWESNTIVRYLSGKHGAGASLPRCARSTCARRTMDGLATLDAHNAGVDRVPEPDPPARRRTRHRRHRAQRSRGQPRHDTARRASQRVNPTSRATVSRWATSPSGPSRTAGSRSPASSGRRSPRSERGASRLCERAGFRTHVQLPLS